MRALIVGFGSIGRRHLANLRRLGIEHVTVLRQAPGSPGLELPEGPDCVVYSLADALAMCPDFAIVCNPATKHVSAAIPLVLHNIHVLVEKPLSHATETATELVGLCEMKAVTLQVGYNFRFYSPFIKIRSALSDGLIGQIVSIRSEAGQYLPDWRPTTDYRQTVSARQDLGGGVLLELSHEFDYVSWFCGQVVRVSAETGKLSGLDLDVEDVAEVTLRFASGAIGSIHLDMVQRPATRSCKVVGTEGTLEWTAADHAVRHYSARDGQWHSLVPPSESDRNLMYLKELEEFIDCFTHGRKPVVGGSDGLRAVAIAEAASQSAREHRAIEI